MKIVYEIKEDRGPLFYGDWRIDYDMDGQHYVVLFSGPNAELRARAYLAWLEEKPIRWRDDNS